MNKIWGILNARWNGYINDRTCNRMVEVSAGFEQMGERRGHTYIAKLARTHRPEESVDFAIWHSRVPRGALEAVIVSVMLSDNMGLPVPLDQDWRDYPEYQS